MLHGWVALKASQGLLDSLYELTQPWKYNVDNFSVQRFAIRDNLGEEDIQFACRIYVTAAAARQAAWPSLNASIAPKHHYQTKRWTWKSRELPSSKNKAKTNEFEFKFVAIVYAPLK